MLFYKTSTSAEGILLHETIVAFVSGGGSICVVELDAGRCVMKFHVSGTWVEVGALVTPEQVAGFLEHAVVPSLRMFAEWEAQGRIQGGIFPGERETAFILEAASSEEV